MKDQEGLLNMMERGEFVSTKVRNTRIIKANMIIFATSNSTERLSKPLLSRFTVLEIPEYTYEEFEGIALRIVKKLHPNVIVQIASSVWKTGSRDIRDVLKIAKLCNPSDGEEDITRLISIHQKCRKTGKRTRIFVTYGCSMPLMYYLEYEYRHCHNVTFRLCYSIVRLIFHIR
jgi:hypothetical protein